MPGYIAALILTPPAGTSPAERWVAEGRLAAARDLVRLLKARASISEVFVHSAETDDGAALASLGARRWEGTGAPFHFGRTLADFVARTRADRLAYFGGSSAPVLRADLLEEAIARLEAHGGASAVVNNYHSTDWALISEARRIEALAEALPTDNPIGWVLDHDADYDIEVLPASAATRADIDTPADLFLLSGHPDLGQDLRLFLDKAPTEWQARLETLRQVLQTPAKNLTVIGRCSSQVWHLLETRTAIWVRLFVEERGMLASGRMERGQVRTLLGEMVDALGPAAFLERLATMTDAVLWDTRVWMASRGAWPSPADRFAADLGWAEQVEDPGLRALALAVAQATIPVLTGGHGVVAGSVYALLESLP